MVDYLRGIKSGAVSGFVSSIIAYGIFLISLGLLNYLIHGSLEPKEKFSTILASISTIVGISVGGGPVSGAVVGAILGVIYAVLYGKLPGKNSIKKAVLFSFLVFILSILILAINALYSYSLISKENPINIRESLISFWQAGIIFGFFSDLIKFPIFGFLLGKLWDYFRANEVAGHSKPTNTKGIKSWYFAAAAVVPIFILALIFIGGELYLMVMGIHYVEKGLGIAVGVLFLTVSGILAIPAVLLKTDAWKKIGAISGVILGALALLATMRLRPGTFLISTYVFYIIFLITGVLLILSGIYYFWKKQ